MASLATSLASESQQLSDRVAIMNRGRIIAMGTSDQIIAEYGSGERLEIRGSKELADYVKITSTDKENKKGLNVKEELEQMVFRLSYYF